MTAATLASAMHLAFLPSAVAMELPLGDESELKGTLDVTLSYGAQWRTEDSQSADMFPLNNGLNWMSEGRVPDRGDLVSNIFGVLMELGLDYRNYGFIGSVSYQYDHEIMNGDTINPLVTEGGFLAPGKAVDSPWSDGAKDYAGNWLELLDAYVYGNWELGADAAPLEVRFGKQVINWGEGLYFLDGGAQQVPLNINKLTTPGADLKEAYIGVESIYAQLGIGDSSSLEAYYHFKWRRTEFPPQGTFFGSDAFFRGGDEPVDQVGIPMRDADIKPDDKGQYGFAFRTFVGEDAEIGLYYSRYHETFPFVRFNAPDSSSVFDANQYWPEDLDMFAVSLATTLGSWSFNAELAYRPDRPLFTTLGVTDDLGRGQEKHDSWHASAHGIWLGGPIDAIGIDNQVALVQVGVDYIDGDTRNLAPNAVITRDHLGSVGTTATADRSAWGVAVEWIGTWNNVLMGNDLSLDIFVQHDFAGDSHFWGNFAEDRWLGATSLTMAIGNDAEIGLTHSWMSSDRSDYEDQDLLIFNVNYKF